MTTLEITFLITTIAMIGLLMMVLESKTSFDDFKKKGGVPKMENPPPPKKSMTQEEFISSMKIICFPSDFESNCGLLEMIDEKYYADIIEIASTGVPIYNSTKMISTVIDLSKKTGLTTRAVLSLWPSFSHLNSLK